MEDFVKILDNRTEEDNGHLGNLRGSGALFQNSMYLNVRDPTCADACQGKIVAALNSRRDYFSVKSQVCRVGINKLWMGCMTSDVRKYLYCRLTAKRVLTQHSEIHFAPLFVLL